MPIHLPPQRPSSTAPMQEKKYQATSVLKLGKTAAFFKRLFRESGPVHLAWEKVRA